MPRKFEAVLPTGARYVDGDDRAELADRPLKLQRARFEPKARYGPRWVIEALLLDSGEIIALGFADNPTRQGMFGQVAADLDADGADAYEPVVLYQSQTGQNPFWTFRSATDAEVAEAEAGQTGSDDEIPAGPPEPLDGEIEPEPPKGKGKS